MQQYTSLERFVEDTLSKLRNQDDEFKLLDITDPIKESQLEGDESRFHTSIQDSFDNGTILQLLSETKDNNNVDEMFLGYLEFDHQLCLALLELFHSGRKWKRVSFQGCPDRSLESCIALMATRGNIETLSLYQNHLEYSGFSCVGMILSLNPPTLTTLDLEDYFCNDSARALMEGLKHNSTLKELDISYCSFESGAIEFIAQGVAENKNLRNLFLVQCNLSDDDVQIILNSLVGHPSINQIDLDYNFCSEGSIEAMGRIIKNNRAPNLSSISICHQRCLDGRMKVPMRIGVIGGALESNSTLKALALSNNLITLDELENFMKGVKGSSVETLNLKGCNITEIGTQVVLSNLPTSLRAIDVNDNCILSDDHQKLCLEYARKNHRLTSFQIDKRVECWPELNYIVRLNAGGRRIFSTDLPAPMGLWPILFARINTIDWRSYDENDEGFREDAIMFILKGAVQLGVVHS